MLTDTHAHLDFRDFDGDRDDVVSRAEQNGVGLIVNPGCDVATSRKAIELSRSHDIVRAAVGIHPNSTAQASPGDMAEISRMALMDSVVAVGETGLDFYRDRSPRDVQARAFAGHLALARELDLPVIVHFREVEMDGIELVGEEALDGIRGVFHCFGGSAGFARILVDRGFYIGFDGPLTYRNSDRADVARSVPLDRTLIETDSPFLAPQSIRGRRNEPAHVLEIAEKLADIHGCSVGEVVDITGKNACDLFGI